MKSNFSYGIIFLVLFSLSVKIDAQSLNAPDWAWAKSLSATHGIYGHDIAIDPNGSGDIYLTGGFEGTTDFDPGPGTFTLSTGSSNDVGTFVAKFNGSGDFIWAKAMVGVAGTYGSPYSMAIDPTGSGAIYTTGRFGGKVDFDPGPNTFNLTAVGNNDIFISKLDTAGNFVWARTMGGPADDFGVSLAYDPEGSGSVYTTGQFRGTVDFDPGDTATFNLISKGNYDIFISKLDSEGNFLWAKRFGSVGIDVSRAIAFDPTGIGGVYTTGQFYGTVDFDPGDSTTFNLIAAGHQENYISKLDPSGNFIWAKQMGTVNLGEFDRDGSIDLDLEGSGEVYVTNLFVGKQDFVPGDTLTSVGDHDVFISKLSDSGEVNWAGAMGGPSLDECIDIAVQPGGSGNIFTLGMFQGTVDFDPGLDSVEVPSSAGKDIFISLLNSSGKFQWVKTIKGVANEYGQGMVADNKFLYVTGAFFGSSISFDSINFINNNISGTGPDLYFAKLDISVATTELESKTQKINLYPNPATNELTIEIDEDGYFNVGITLLNVLGEVVYFSPGENIGRKKTIDISALATGIYFVELNIDGNRVVEKVVKE